MKTSQALSKGKKIRYDATIDRDGNLLGVGDTVDVPVSGVNEFEFTGEIVDVYPNGAIVVKDQEDDCFTVKSSVVIKTERI